jgi:hypothetical protein
MTIRIGRFAIIFGGLNGEKNVQFQITFHWGYKSPNIDKDE